MASPPMLGSLGHSTSTTRRRYDQAQDDRPAARGGSPAGAYHAGLVSSAFGAVRRTERPRVWVGPLRPPCNAKPAWPTGANAAPVPPAVYGSPLVIPRRSPLHEIILAAMTLNGSATRRGPVPLQERSRPTHAGRSSDIT